MLELVDRQTDQTSAFRNDVLIGLSRPQKTLPSRWLYDDEGCALFEAITHLEEYYPTRTETAILKVSARDIADFCGPDATLLEYGPGAATKTEIVLDALKTPRLYIPIDIATNFLQETAARMRRRFPFLRVCPLTADFTDDFEIPIGLRQENRVAFFPGSTIGNLSEREALAFFRRMADHVGRFGKAIIGSDLKKDIPTLLKAYDDRQGITAAFNRNLLTRANRELGADFVADQYVHEARWNEAESAIEMHLVSLMKQAVTIGGQSFGFRAGETIHTESSRKYSLDSFSRLASRAGWRVTHVWTDPRNYFAVFGLKVTR